ncbi:MAG: hypothetical protein QGG20_05555 [Dehalococcoidia bacterium]|jgi:hypothetical protein|nr:hypothetical protein [Dehalococcoidia bacterium]|tara:strand:- start:39 stop:392 length:354 start_codon:yes stop_codon:yes gene_type:complete
MGTYNEREKRFGIDNISELHYMVELDHDSKSCIAANPKGEYANLLVNLSGFAQPHGVRIIDGWSFPVGHRMWFVVVAPDAHKVSAVFYDAKVHLWNRVDVSPVIPFEEFELNVLGRV